MENAVEALEMAFAMLVFIIALALALFVFGRVKASSDYLFELGDETKYMEYVRESGQDVLYSGSNSKQTRVARVLSAKDLIPVLYSYSTELASITVDFNLYEQGENSQNKIFVFGLGYLGAFNPQLISRNASSINNPTFEGTIGSFSFWVYDWGAEQKTGVKEFIDAFISGGKTKRPIKMQQIKETIVREYITATNTYSTSINKDTLAINNNYSINFGNNGEYLMKYMGDEYYFLETYTKTNIENDPYNLKTTIAEEQAESSSSEFIEKEYIYVHYQLKKR